MPRMNLIEPKNATGPAATLFKGPLKNNQNNVFKALAVNPPVLEAFLNFSNGVKGNALTETECEVVALTTSQWNNCEYCLAAHTQIGQNAGLTEPDITAIRSGDVNNNKWQALIDFTQAILETKGFITDQQFQNFQNAGFNDAAVTEVIGMIAATTFTNFFNQVNETPVDFPMPATV